MEDARRLRQSYLADLAEVLRESASGVRTGDSTAAAEALGRSRQLEGVLTRWQGSLEAGREVARISPIRRGRSDLNDQRLVVPLTRATRNLRVLIRRVTVAIETGDPLPTRLPELLDELASLLDPATAAEDALAPLIAFAGALDPVVLGATSMSGQVVVAQLRVTLVDLLDGLGLDKARAREALPSLHG